VSKEEAKEKISKKRMKTKFLYVSCDSRGTHAMQGFLESLNKSKFSEIIEEMFLPCVLKFAYNKNATHVLIKFIKTADLNNLEKIYDIISKNFSLLSQDSNGLPVVKASI
jgi:hypothetical protein